MRPALVLLLLVLPPTAAAQDADLLFAEYVETGAGEAGQGLRRVEERVTLTAGTLALLAPVDADGDGVLRQADLDARADALARGVWEEMPLMAEGVPCVRTRAGARLREGSVELDATFACGPGVLGFGFAGVLAGYGRGPSVVRALLGFNLGVELGQAAVVLVLFPLVCLLLRRQSLARWSVHGISGLVLLGGAGWLLQRVGG